MARKKDIRQETSDQARLRDLTDFERGLLKETGRKVTVRFDGEMKETDLAQVVISKHVQVAVGGSPHALGQVSRSIIEAQILNQAHVREDVEKGRNIKKALEKRLERVVGDGADPKWVIPHPDDILIIEGKGWSIKGPVDEDDLKPIRELVEMRNTLLLQSVLDERSASRTGESVDDIPAVEQPGSASTVFAHMLNDSLPERFRISDVEMVMATDRFHRLNKRELLKAAYRAWARIGRPKPRGKTFPTWDEVEPRMRRLAAVSQLVLEDISTGELVGERQIAERLAVRLSET